MGTPRLRWEDIGRDSLVAAEYKRLETSKGQGYLEVNYGRGQSPIRPVAPLRRKKKKKKKKYP